MVDLFGVRKRGDEHFYDPARDFLACTPEVLVKGAAFAVDPASWISGWLKEHGVNTPRTSMKECLTYILRVAEDCRSEALEEVFDATKVNPIVFQGMMMGVGTMMLHKFNRLFRTFRFTDTKNKGVLEPTQHVDINAAIHMFNEMAERSGARDA